MTGAQGVGSATCPFILSRLSVKGRLFLPIHIRRLRIFFKYISNKDKHGEKTYNCRQTLCILAFHLTWPVCHTISSYFICLNFSTSINFMYVSRNGQFKCIMHLNIDPSRDLDFFTFIIVS